MNKRLLYYFIVIILIIQGCSSPKLTVLRTYPAIKNLESIFVIEKDKPNLEGAEEIGFIEIGNLEFSWRKHGLQEFSY